MELKPLRLLTLALQQLLLFHPDSIGSSGSVGEKPPLYDVTSPFEFSKPQDMNKLGIFPTIMVQVEFKSDEKLHLWRTNVAFTTPEMLLAWEEACVKQHNTHYSEKEGDYLQWGNCTFSKTQITALLEKGETERRNKNFTYIEIKTKPFTRIRQKDGEMEKRVCILNEFPDRKAYIVLMTNVFDDPSDPIYKLEMFLPMALGFFEDVIEMDKILQFTPMDYINSSRSKHYQCLVGIATGESMEELRTKCRFKCVDKTELRGKVDVSGGGESGESMRSGFGIRRDNRRDKINGEEVHEEL